MRNKIVKFLIYVVSTFCPGFEVDGYDNKLTVMSPQFSAVGRYLMVQKDNAKGGKQERS